MGCALSRAGATDNSTTDVNEILEEMGPDTVIGSRTQSEVVSDLSTLAESQKELIQESWKILHQDIARLGVIVFIRLFETHPECKDVFFMFRDIDDIQQLQLSRELQAHGLRVMSFIEKSVARLQQEDKLQQLAFELGRCHCRYNALPKYFEYVAFQFMTAVKPILKEKWTSEVDDAWKALFKYLISLMKKGFQEEEKTHLINKSTYPKKQLISKMNFVKNNV
ncbi:neuroglobin [Protopterus annectens]|uniref:neuroglobin n=1 Tax=Protopterus annectens TaxID=7888 RepID=UPI001CFA5663|nr:neuroglobin [Protopterus annectens]